MPILIGLFDHEENLKRAVRHLHDQGLDQHMDVIGPYQQSSQQEQSKPVMPGTSTTAPGASPLQASFGVDDPAHRPVSVEDRIARLHVTDDVQRILVKRVRGGSRLLVVRTERQIEAVKDVLQQAQSVFIKE